jgi:uncharacterized protein
VTLKPDTYKIRIATSLSNVSELEWNACAHAPNSLAPNLDALSTRDEHNPFLSHAYLLALETTGCATPQTGWNSAHVLIETPDGQLQAAAPCYIKMHSMGEYVFDHAWADAYERAGGQYYPKLQVSVPFTPATGDRLFLRGGTESNAARTALISGLRALCRKAQASSIHVTFASENEWNALGSAGFLQRNDQQFHWINEGYVSFDAFLETLTARKRKMIKRERKDALANNGITIERLTGDKITEAHWDAFFEFYTDTSNRKWGRPYLTRKFFSEIGRSLPSQILLIMAKREGKYIAGAINFMGSNTLYGRNWGAIEDHPFLHFEVCYYQAIEFAIERGLARVEAGAQGEHKLARGYRPSLTYSAHDFVDSSFGRAVSDYLQRERLAVEVAKGELEDIMPFKKL